MRVIISSYFLRQAQRSSSFVAAGAAAADTQQINRSFFRLFLSRAFARPLLASLVLSVPANWLSSFCFPTGTSIYRRLVSLGKLAFLLRSRGWFASKRRDARKDARRRKRPRAWSLRPARIQLAVIIYPPAEARQTTCRPFVRPAL